LCRLLSVHVVEGVLQFLDGELVEMIHYLVQQSLSKKL
jgi:hypothetical protein